MSFKSGLVFQKSNSTSYLFRSHIPKDLQDHFGFNEFQISLKSSSLRYSKSLSMRLYGITQRIYEQVRVGQMKELSVSDIKEILRIEVRKSILHVHHVEEGTNLFVESKIMKSVSQISEQEENFNQRLQTDLKSVQNDIENDLGKILKSQGYDVQKNSVPFKRLRRWVIDLRKMRYQWKKDILLNRQKSEEEWDNEFLSQVEKTFKLGLVEGSNESNVVTQKVVEKDDSGLIPISSENNIPISELIQEYLTERDILLERGKVKQKTNEEYENSLDLFLEIVGDKRINEISQKDGRGFRETLKKLPPRRKTVDGYKKKSIKEILEMNLPVSKTMTPRTINQNYIQKCSSWMKWCIDLGYFEGDNIFKGKTVKGESRDDDFEKQFSLNELKTLFDHQIYSQETLGRNSHIRYPTYWVPIIGLFTGCRLNEICQIHVSDVQVVDKIWCLNINQESKNKSVKNPSSRRIIPLPQVILELGFTDYVQIIGDKGYERVFHELTLGRDGYGKNLSRFFNQSYLPKLGIKKKGKNFHSFRHTLSNHLKQKGINENYVHEYTGHKWDSMTFGTYSQKYEPRILFNECVSKISFDIDFNPLKVSSWKHELEKSISRIGVSKRTTELDNLVKVMRSQKDEKGNPLSFRKISEIIREDHGHIVSHESVRRILKEHSV